MAHINILPDEFLEAVVNRLLSELNMQASSCFIGADPDASPPTPQTIWYVVSPTPSLQFDEGSFIGGGLSHLTTYSVLTVTIHVAQQQDQGDKADFFYLDDQRGIYALIRPVLVALAMWNPLKTDGTYMLREPIIPQDANITPAQVRGHGSIQIGLKVSWDWDFVSP